MKKTLSIVIVIIIVLISLFLCSCSEKPQGIGEAGISNEEFEQLSLGMTHDTVDEIIGGSGELISETENDDDNYYVTVFLYRYEGEQSGYAELEFTLKTHKGYTLHDFQTFSLTSKKKYDLQ